MNSPSALLAGHLAHARIFVSKNAEFVPVRFDATDLHEIASLKKEITQLQKKRNFYTYLCASVFVPSSDRIVIPWDGTGPVSWTEVLAGNTSKTIVSICPFESKNVKINKLTRNLVSWFREELALNARRDTMISWNYDFANIIGANKNNSKKTHYCCSQ